MALVSYDFESSNDEISDEEEENSTSKVILKVQNGNTNSNQSSSFEAAATTNNIFTKLPEAKTVQITEESDQLEDFIPTVSSLKEKKKVQIPIPSLSEFDDLNDHEPANKKLKPSGKGSGLLGLLPPVHTVPKAANTMFVPNTVKRKVPAAKPVVPPKTIKQAVKVVAKKKGAPSDSETDDDDDMPLPETFDDEMWEKVCGRPKTAPTRVIEVDNVSSIEQPQDVPLTIAPEPEKPYEGLNNEAFKELVGKTKRPLGNIKMIDINEEEIMPDKDLWMTKSLTDPELAPKPEPDETIDTTKKRKHHITYLAQQAKEKEQELKAAWATSKGNRLMSRAKYGF